MEADKKVQKRVSESYTEQLQFVMNSHINGYGRLFGGTLLQWIDVMFGVVARRHCGCEVTTAAIDHMEFLSPAYLNDLVKLEGRVTWVGRSSLEVRVDTYAQALGGEWRPVNVAYALMVALDANEKPAPAPGLLLETEEQKREFTEGAARQEARKAARLKKQ
ncbi:MAG: acyl-CoA thioesterase [Clostridiales bacterium]|nr:acyl-CoA thioesterase [Clostridiales bacterium]MDY2835496.1 acyl-CoA thioesterase [Candidatus Aphodomonas sp.]